LISSDPLAQSTLQGSQPNVRLASQCSDVTGSRGVPRPTGCRLHNNEDLLIMRKQFPPVDLPKLKDVPDRKMPTDMGQKGNG